MNNQPSKQDFALILKKVGVKDICPMCGKKTFVLADGYFSDPVQKDLMTYSIGGNSIPSISLICTNCGFLSKHVIGVLASKTKDINKKDGKRK